jgi:phosphoglycolate phosphatase-like HAD superfamily hydrolase
LLFDIDGTLIRSHGAGLDALEHALRSVFGKQGADEVEISGRTDRGIARSLFQHHGIADTADNWQRLRDAYLRALPDCLRQRGGNVLPGVESLLAQLAERSDMMVGLLTGNIREGARLKLAHFELHEHFRFGGFGDEHFERDAVAHEALRTARAHVPRPLEPRDVWVIGDTPLDIRCARAIEARVLAVATGMFSRGELAAHEPDLLFDNLADIELLWSLLPAR